MPILSNPRHEIFAQELAAGKTADEAYQLAGYAENRHNASRLRTNETVLRRVAELQSRGAKRAEVTVESLIAEAEEVRAQALVSGQLSAAVAAIREKGILSGKRIERGERGDPGDFDRLDSGKLREEILREANELGIELGRLN